MAVEKIGVIGAGQMGTGISHVLSLAGFSVTLDDVNKEALAAALQGMDEVVAPTGIVVLEHARRQPAPEQAGGLGRVRELPSGDSGLAFYSLTRPC